MSELSMLEVIKRRREQKRKAENTLQNVEDFIVNEKDFEKIQLVKIDLLMENPYQPRIEINEEELEELKKSIEQNGLLSPVIVTKNNVIVAGHRRIVACKKLNWQKIPAIIKDDIDDKTLAVLALLENVQRVDLNPVELALSYKNLLDQGIFKSQKELSESLGFSPLKVNRILKILKLDQRIINEINRGRTKDLLALNMLNSIKDNDLQYQLFLEFLEKGRDYLEEKIKKFKEIKKENPFDAQPKFIIKKNSKKGEIKILLDKKSIPEDKIEQLNKEIESLVSKYLEENEGIHNYNNP